jgi:cell division protein FtsA
MKIAHGSALVTEAAKGQTISITNDLGLELKRVKAEHLQIIMSLRLEEVFELIAREMEEAGLTDYLRAGVFLCGGGSRVPGLGGLAEKVFQMNVTTGQAPAISGLATALNQPEFTTAIGLVKYGALMHQKTPPPVSFLTRIMQLVGKMVSFIKELFD